MTGRQRGRIERGRFHATQTLFYARGDRVAIVGARMLDAKRPDSVIEILDLAGNRQWDIPTSPGAQGAYLDEAGSFLLVEIRNPLRLVQAP